MKRKAKYYQGLSFRGEKRADWAAPDGAFCEPDSQPLELLLPMIAFRGTVSALEWFLSTARERLYMDFVNAHKQDEQLRMLEQTEQGIEGSIMEWLNMDRTWKDIFSLYTVH